MKKLFISQPMRGKTDEEILAGLTLFTLVGCSGGSKAAVVPRRIAEAAIRRGCGIFFRGLGRSTRMQNRTRMCH